MTEDTTEHTPRPWDLYPKTNVKFVQLRLDDYRHAARCVNAHDDLLAALEDVMSSDPDMPSHKDTMDQAEAAIAKAKGATGAFQRCLDEEPT
jgi:hypothetical protein